MMLLYLLGCMKHVEQQSHLEFVCDIQEGDNIMGGIVDQVDNNIVAVTFGVESLYYFNCIDIIHYIGRGPDYEALQ